MSAIFITLIMVYTRYVIGSEIGSLSHVHRDVRQDLWSTFRTTTTVTTTMTKTVDIDRDQCMEKGRSPDEQANLHWADHRRQSKGLDGVWQSATDNTLAEHFCTILSERNYASSNKKGSISPHEELSCTVDAQGPMLFDGRTQAFPDETAERRAKLSAIAVFPNEVAMNAALDQMNAEATSVNKQLARLASISDNGRRSGIERLQDST
ncbi:hypothetical protein LTR86_010385 [Recurvomyces mirabilis]|nr:hypothetical protein LTR86_010385 [Recurvomyces mirabilis]